MLRFRKTLFGAYLKMLNHTLTIPLPARAYPVYIGHSLLGQKELFERHLKGRQVMIVTQKNVADLYLNGLLHTLSAYHCDLMLLPQGEKHKNLTSWRKVLDHLVANRHERSTTLIALGGGVIGDVTGFAAACYQRGVNYIQIPTTLIAQVDSSIGGKTGVNHPDGKNLIGAIHQPLCVLADTALLETLPRREFVAGMAEVIKSGLIRDAAFFSWLEKNRDSLLQGDQEALLHAVYTAVRIKGEIVAQDEREQTGVRSLLNFGHTFGHALEAAFNYRGILHGEAVALGMRLASLLSTERGWLEKKDAQRIQDLLTAVALPTRVNRKFDLDKLFSHLLQDKKIADGRMNWVLLKAIGEAVLTDQVSREDLMKLIPRAVLQTDAGVEI